MSLSVETLAVAKKYTDDSLAGAGAVAGVPCQIQSISAITGGNRVTFLWVDNNGDSHTSTMDVMNGAQGDPGEKGDTGLGIKSMAINAQEHLIITYDDDTTEDAGEIPKQDLSDYQTKELETPLTIGGQSETEVEGALAALNTKEVADIQDVYAVMGQNGAKNLIPYPYFNGDSRDTNGILFTVNSDGSVTISGEATADAYFRLTYTTGDVHIPLVSGKSYIMSASGKANIAMLLRDSSTANVASARAADATYACTTSGDFDAIICVDNGADYTTPFTVYPMLRFASDTDSSYQPYAKTNKELTDKAAEIVSDLDNEIATRSALGAHNLLPVTLEPQTYQGITYSVGLDGSISFSGSNSQAWNALRTVGTVKLPAGSYIISKAPDGAKDDATWWMQIQNADTSAIVVASIEDEDIAFTLAAETSLNVILYIDGGYSISGTKVLYPMIRLATDADAAYSPYVPTNMGLLSDKDNGILGAKNLCPKVFSNGSHNGITYTVNSDGSITAAGTIGAGQTYSLLDSATFTLKAGRYILSGNPVPGSGAETKRSTIRLFNGSTVIVTVDSTQEKSFVLDADAEIYVRISLNASGKTYNDVFYPMIRLITDTDNTYQPYAMTNRELTDAVDGMMMKVGRYTKTVKGTNTTYGALIDQICADMKTLIDGFADTNTKVIPMSITIDGLVTLFVRSDQYKKGDNFNIVAYCTSCDGTTFYTFYLRGLSGSGNSTIYRQDVTASSQAINDFTSTAFTGDKNISLIYDRYQIV